MDWKKTTLGFCKIKRNKNEVKVYSSKNPKNKNYEVKKFKFKSEEVSKDFYYYYLSCIRINQLELEKRKIKK